jgi:pimeloyl-ACP methyl ester carboxylesterase
MIGRDLMRRRLPTPEPPAEIGIRDGLAFSRWLPAGEPWAGLLVLHGADSCKENHHDMARAARAADMAAVCGDLRGHGASVGDLDARVLDDVATLAGLLPDGLPRGVRGSSMGGALAILAAAAYPALFGAVVTVCPASADGLLRGLRTGRFGFRANAPSLEAFLLEHDVSEAAARLEVPLLLLHAEGDERVPVEHSRELARRAPDARLIAVPGGHHGSVQHDAELQGEAVRWLRRRLARPEQG